MKLHEIKPVVGSTRRRKVVGRGLGSGHGTTAGRGGKGQTARTGSSIPAWFEGGQMPLIRRLPKRGFTNVFRRNYTIINVESLERFESGQEVTPALLVSQGVIRSRNDGVKVLGAGSLTKALIVHAHKFSQSAAAKIEAAGGKVQVIARD